MNTNRKWLTDNRPVLSYDAIYGLRLRLGLAILLGLLVAGTGRGVSGAETNQAFVLLDNGRLQPQIVVAQAIVTNASYHRYARPAIQDLCQWLGRLAGREVNFVKDQTATRGPTIEIGLTEYVRQCMETDPAQKKFYAQVPELGPEGFLIKVEPEHVAIVGRTECGLWLGILHFLNDYARVRHYQPDADYTRDEQERVIGAAGRALGAKGATPEAIVAYERLPDALKQALGKEQKEPAVLALNAGVTAETIEAALAEYDKLPAAARKSAGKDRMLRLLASGVKPNELRAALAPPGVEESDLAAGVDPASAPLLGLDEKKTEPTPAAASAGKAQPAAVPLPLFLALPADKTIRLPVGEKRFEPAFRGRALSGIGGAKWFQWKLFNGLLMEPWEYYNFHHNMDVAIPYALRKEHPESVTAVVKGKGGWQACFSNPDAIRICAEAALKAFAENPRLEMFSLGSNDGGRFCACSNCLRLVAGEDPINRMPKFWHQTAAYGHFLNEVVARVVKQYPDKMIGGLAYHETSEPPGRLVLHPNIALQKTFYVAEMTAEQVIAELEPWRPHIKRLGLYEYAYPGAIPRFQTHKLQKVLQYLAAHGGNYYYAEAYPDFQIEGPKAWLITRLLLDPRDDLDVLLRQYCRDLFGEAADIMLEYWQLCWRLWDEEPRKASGASAYFAAVPQGLAIAPYQRRMAELLARAEQTATGAREKERIAYFKAPVTNDMAILAEIGAAVLKLREKSSSVTATLTNAVAAVTALRALEDKSRRLAHRGHLATSKASEPAFKESNYLPEGAARALLHVASLLARTGQSQGGAASLVAAMEKERAAAAAQFAEQPAAASWERLNASWQTWQEGVGALPRLAAAPVVDGKLDEAFSAAGRKIAFPTPRAVAGVADPGVGPRSPIAATSGSATNDGNEVWFGHDDQNLYVGWRTREENPISYVMSDKPEQRIFAGAAATVALTPAADPDSAISLTVDIKGNRWTRRGGKPWNTTARIAQQYDEANKTWTIEIALPWSDLGAAPAKGAVYGLNFLRHQPVVQRGKVRAIFAYNQATTLSWHPGGTGAFGDGSPYNVYLCVTE